MLKLKSDGVTQWRRVYGGTQVEYAHSVIELKDGSLFVVGNTTSANSEESDGDVRFRHGDSDADGHDIWAIRLDASGKLFWQRSFGGSEGYNLNGLGASVIQTKDRGVLIVGFTDSTDGDIQHNHGDFDYLAIKLSVSDLSKTHAVQDRPRENVGERSSVGKAGRALASRNDGKRRSERSPQQTAYRTTTPAPRIAWQKTFGGSDADRVFESPQALVKKREGGFLLVGSTKSRNGDVSIHRGDWDVFVASLAESGKAIWKRTYGGSGKDIGVAIAQDKEGGVVFVATSDSVDGDVGGAHGIEDIWVVKLSPDNGDVVWKRTLGGSAPDIAASVIATEDGGYLVGGSSQSQDGERKSPICAYDYWVVKLDRDGKIEWEKSYGGTSNDYLSQIIQTRDGGYAAIGRTESHDGDVKKFYGGYDYWLVKLDPKGKLEWSRNYGTPDWDFGTSLFQTRDGGYVLSGYNHEAGGDVAKTYGQHDYWVVKVDESGDLEWEKTYGGTTFDLGYGIVQTHDGGFAMVGGSHSSDGVVTGNHGESDAWVIKLDRKGDLLWQRSLGGSGYDFAYAVVETRDGGLAIAGETFSDDGDVSKLHGEEDIWLVKLAPEDKKVARPERQ